MVGKAAREARKERKRLRREGIDPDAPRYDGTDPCCNYGERHSPSTEIATNYHGGIEYGKCRTCKCEIWNPYDKLGNKRGWRCGNPTEGNLCHGQC
tara:strand:+ start:148 stop:435 length:288 start_codon:yes stop_codon:yes gene_type:complete